MVEVVKFSGEKEKFNPKKIIGTLKRAGASKEQSKRILKNVQDNLRDGITTKEILDMVFAGLRETPGIAAKYDLKRALMALGPGGYTFEKYFADVLRHYGYESKINQMIKGKRIMQEVDIAAKKDSTYMVECKYYNYPGNYAGTKETMYTYARFLDTNSRMHNFDFPWLATNTKCSWSAIEYSKGVGLKITSWKYPAKESLQRLVEAKKLYPVTVLKTVNKFAKQRLLDSGITMINTLVEKDSKEILRKVNISESELRKAILESKQVCG